MDGPDLLRRGVESHRPVPEEDRLVQHRLHIVDQMGGEQDAPRVVHGVHQLPQDLPPGYRVHAAQRLIQQIELGLPLEQEEQFQLFRLSHGM